MTSLLRSCLVAVTLVILAIAPARAEVAFQEVTSPKGITAWLVEDYSVPLITIRFSFSGGSTQDPVGKEGLANLMTYLFDEGAGDLASEPFQIALDKAGAEMGFSADLDGVYGHMRLLADQRDEALALLKLAVQSPRFDQEAIDRMRMQVVTELTAAAQNPGTAAQQQWLKTLYGDHPYARPVPGTLATVPTLTSDDLRALHTALFARDNLYVGIVGAIDADTARAVLDDVFGALPATATLIPVAEVEPPYGADLKVDYPLPQTFISMAYPGMRRDSPDFFAASLLNQILGGTFTSRLTSEVREKRGLAYDVSSSLVTLDHTNSLVIATSTRSPETLGVIQSVVADLAENGPTEAELAAAKKYAIGSYPISELNSSVAIANTLVSLQIKGLGIDYVTAREQEIEAVTLDQVKSVAARLLGTRPTILQLGP